MGLVRLMVALVVVAILWRMVGRWLKPGGKARDKNHSAKMVKCETCGLHVPESEALTLGERVFCSEAHRSEAKDN